MKNPTASARGLPALKSSIILLLLSGLTMIGAGCSPKEVTALQRKQGANLVSEAEFANTLRDYARAEGLYAQAVVLCPDTPDYWLNLGAARRRLGNRAGAQMAYEQVLDLAKAAYRRDGKDPQPLLQQAYVLALLGRIDDARAVVEKAQKQHPDSRELRLFIENRELDRLVNDPVFKQIAL